jgi:hypothetical protein
MHELYHADTVWLEKKENFQKQTYRNRFEILGANGELALSVPVIKPGGNRTPIEKVLVSHAEPWVKNYIKAIESAYNSSPFFMYYRDEIFNVLGSGIQRLFDLNLELTRTLMKLTGFEKSLMLTKEYHNDPDEGDIIDLRQAFTPKNTSQVYIFDPYPQVFSQKHGFREDLSIIDLLFNEGPAAIDYLKKGVRRRE